MKKVIIAGPVMFQIRMRDILGSDAYEFFETSTNDDVCRIHRAEKVDLVLTKKGIDGVRFDELCAQLRNDPGLEKVSVVLACDGDSSHAVREETLKANGVVSLDTENEELVNILMSYINVPKRYQYRTVMQIKVDGQDYGAPISCVISNLSSTGLLMETDSNLEEGVGLSISFYLPKSRRILANGHVVRAISRSSGGGGQYGIRFEKLDTNMCREIDSFVQSRS